MIRFSMRLSLILSAFVFVVFGGTIFAQSQYESSTDFAKYAMKLRESALLKVEPKVIMSPTKMTFTGSGPRYASGPSLMVHVVPLSDGPDGYGWQLNIVSTIF